MIMAKKPSFDTVWRRIKKYEGRVFKTKRGARFTYKITGNTLHWSRTKRTSGKSQAEKMLALAPVSGPGKVNHIINGASYLWGIFDDRRIRKTDW